VCSGGIEVCDLGAVPSDAFRLRVPNGTFAIEARLIDFDGSLRVSRVRGRLKGKTTKLGRQLAEISVDYAAIVIGDLRAARELDDYAREDLNDAVREFMQTEFCEKCTVRAGGIRFQLAVCPSGFGDGKYPVFQLDCGGRPAGIEVELIRDGHVLRNGRKKTRHSTDATGTFDQMMARMRAALSAAERSAGQSKRGEFALTGEQSVLMFVRDHKDATTHQLRDHLASEGRRGSADSIVSKLCRAKKIKRAKLAGGRGSSYRLVDPKMSIWHHRPAPRI
jgi:hypothetical protein